jgi:hypothetical protein
MYEMDWKSAIPITERRGRALCCPLGVCRFMGDPGEAAAQTRVNGPPRSRPAELYRSMVHGALGR